MPYKIVKLPEDEEKELPKSGKFRISKIPQQNTDFQDFSQDIGRGVSQGALDIASIPALATFPLERGIQKALGVQDRPGRALPGQEARIDMQSNILDKINAGQTPSIGELLSLSDEDDILPLGSAGTGLSNIQQRQEDIPEGGIIQESSRRATRSIPFALGGASALIPALSGEAGGLVASESVKALGGGEGAQTAADIIGGIGAGVGASKLLYTPKASIGVSRNIPAIAEKQGGVLSAIEKQASSKTVEKRLLSLSDDILSEADKRMTNISQEALSDFGQFSARETEDLITQGNRSSILNRVSPVEKLPQQAWKDISESANEIFKTERKVYSNLYENVRNAARDIEYTPRNARRVAQQQIAKITNIETSPAGYKAVKDTMQSALRDLGLDEQVLSDMSILVKKDVPISADKLMDLSIRLNDAINYEALTPTVKDFLKPIQRAVKEDFRQAIARGKKGVLDDFNKAEDLYKKTANRFGKDIINKLRSTENPEFLGSDFLQPSNFENLLNIFGKGNTRISEAERQIVDLIGRQNQKTAQDTLRQLEPFLSKNAKEASKEFIDLGDKLTVPGQRKLLQQNMLGDVAESITTGTRPEFTLRAMRTPQGYQAAKDTFARTGQGRKLFEVLERQTVDDLFNSITKDGQIDWGKAKKILSDPGYETVMTEIMGVDGVQMIKNIEKWSNNITSNLTKSKFSQPSTFNKFYNTLDTPTKLMLTAFFGAKMGFLTGVAATAGTVALKRLGARVITSPIAKQAIRNLATPNISGKDLLRSAVILNDSVKE